jgi:hypothetical protein
MELDVVDEKPLLETPDRNFTKLEEAYKNFLNECDNLDVEINRMHNFQDKEKLKKLYENNPIKFSYSFLEIVR